MRKIRKKQERIVALKESKKKKDIKIDMIRCGLVYLF